jgi:hypothetical protein
MMLLWRHRRSLDPPTSTNDEETALFVRDHNEDLAPLRFLFHDLRIDKWWFEIGDMYRRILFVGIVPLCSPLPATRASLGVVLGIMSLAYFIDEKPYRVEVTNFVAVVAQYAILITYYAALAIETGVMISFGLEDLGMGLFLCATNLLVFALVLGLGWRRFHRQHAAEEQRKRKADRRESAHGFSKQKFKTTFEAINHSSVPASHVMLFYYASLADATLAQCTGIPAQRRFGGIPFTIRAPHDITSAEDEIFSGRVAAVSSGGKAASSSPSSSWSSPPSSPSLTPASAASSSSSPSEKKSVMQRASVFIGRQLRGRGSQDDVLRAGAVRHEVLVVLALPKRLLEPLPGYEGDASLHVLSGEVLRALRPSTFTAVFNQTHWLNGVVCLPPTSILRVYTLNEDTLSSSKSSSLPLSMSRLSSSPAARLGLVQQESSTWGALFSQRSPFLNHRAAVAAGTTSGISTVATGATTSSRERKQNHHQGSIASSAAASPWLFDDDDNMELGHHMVGIEDVETITEVAAFVKRMVRPYPYNDVLSSVCR